MCKIHNNSQNNELFLLATTKDLPVKNILFVKVDLFRTLIRGH